MFDIGNILFTQVPEEERVNYAAKIAEEGSKIGYKLRQLCVCSSIHITHLHANERYRPLTMAFVTNTNNMLVCYPISPSRFKED